MTTDTNDPNLERKVDRLAFDLAIRLALLGGFVYFAVTLTRPFLPLLLWSVILAVTFYPAYEWLRTRLGGRSTLAAFLLTAFAIAVVAGPTTVLLSSLFRSLDIIGHRFAEGQIQIPPAPAFLAQIPFVGNSLTQEWTLASSNLQGFLREYGRQLLGVGEWTLHAVAGMAGSVAVVMAAVVTAGFIYAPGPRLTRGVRLFSERVAGARGSAFVDLAGVTIRKVARGVIGVALIQSLLVGLGLIVAKVPAAGLLTLGVMILGIVQLGAAPIALPVLIWYWLTHEMGPALLLTLYLVPVAFSDNLLKPMLMGKGLKTPIIVIFAGVIGGTISYGLIGLFIGPVVLAVFYDLVLFWVVGGDISRHPTLRE